MASKDAEQLIVPSRPGAASKEAIQVIRELTKLGVKIITPKCDVSVASSVHRVLEDYAQVMSPIRGCINATMVLQDSVFDSMTRALKSSIIMEPPHSTSEGPRLLHSALFCLWNCWKRRLIQLRSRLHVSRLVISIPRVPEPKGSIHRPRSHAHCWRGRREQRPEEEL